jgi:hypothetical protein
VILLNFMYPRHGRRVDFGSKMIIFQGFFTSVCLELIFSTVVFTVIAYNNNHSFLSLSLYIYKYINSFAVFVM